MDEKDGLDVGQPPTVTAASTIPITTPQPPPQSPPPLPPPSPPTGHKLKMAQRAADPWENHRRKTRAGQVGTVCLALLNREAKSCRKEPRASAAGFVWEPLRERRQESGCCLGFAVRFAVLCNDPAVLRRRRAAQSAARSIPGAGAVQEAARFEATAAPCV